MAEVDYCAVWAKNVLTNLRLAGEEGEGGEGGERVMTREKKGRRANAYLKRSPGNRQATVVQSTVHGPLRDQNCSVSIHKQYRETFRQQHGEHKCSILACHIV